MLHQIQSVIKKGLVELNAVCRDDGQSKLVFTQKEWDQLAELCEILTPFKEYTDILQGEEVTIIKMCSIVLIRLTNMKTL